MNEIYDIFALILNNIKFVNGLIHYTFFEQFF